MQRTVSYRSVDDDRLLSEQRSVAFRLTSEYERGAAELGVPAGTRVRVELRDGGGHLLDSLTYMVPSTA